MEPLVAGQVLGDYSLVERAGVGGFSEVWRARKLAPETEGDEEDLGPAPETPAVFALKIPREPQFVEHLRREARIQQASPDPRVVPLLEVQLEHDPPFVVMPWIEGQDFPVPEGCPAPEEQVVALRRALDLVQILRRLHAGGLVHGDLKPANLRLDTEGNVHVLDLGLGRLQIETNLQRSLAQSLVSLDGSSLAGTLDYLAPELFEGAKPGKASDVYAFGVLLHQVLTGRSPAFGVRPSDVNPFLPRGSDALIGGLLAADPEARSTELMRVTTHLRWLIRQEERCLARRNGHARRRVFQQRMRTLRRGGKALALSLLLLGLAYGLYHASSRNLTPSDSRIPLIVLGVTFALGWGAVLAATTINAWILGIPGSVYKHRPGQRVWNFLMQ